MKEKLCGIFGENPDELVFGYDEEDCECASMKMQLIYAIKGVISNDCYRFVSTLDQGSAMWGAEAVVAMKELGGDIELVAVPTDDDQATRWHPERRERYFDLLTKADEVIEPDEELFGEDYIFKNADSIIIQGDLGHERLRELSRRAKACGITVYTV